MVAFTMREVSALTASRACLVTHAESSLVWVDLYGEDVPCRVLRHGLPRGRRPAAGDEVVVERRIDGRYYVTGICEPREVQLVVVVEAPRLCRRLDFAPRAASAGRATETLVVVNKCDLADEPSVRSAVASLVEAGTHVVLTSTADGRGVEELRSRLAGRVSVLTGWPRAGKTSLVEALYPGYRLAATESRDSRSSVRYSPLPGGGYLAL